MVFARNVTAKRGLEEQLRVHSVLRRYLALAHGVVHAARIESFILQEQLYQLLRTKEEVRGGS